MLRNSLNLCRRIHTGLGGLALAVCVHGLSPGSAHAQACSGDCDGDGSVGIHELVLVVAIALGNHPLDDCPSADRAGSGRVAIGDLVAAAGNALRGCPVTPTGTVSASPTSTPSTSPMPPATASATATETPTRPPTATATGTEMPPRTPTSTATAIATETATPTPSATPTATPSVTPAPASLLVLAQMDWPADAVVEVSGERLRGPAPGDAARAYGPVRVSIASGGDDATAEIPIPVGLAPGVWVHHIAAHAHAADYTQHQQSLVIAGDTEPNVVEWRLFRTVLTVTRGDDAGDGTCDESCTLRDAVDSAPDAPQPVLIRFAGDLLPVDADGSAQIRIDHNKPLRLRAPGTVIDGRDVVGNPSPLIDFAERVYPTTITLVAENANPIPAQACPCQENHGGAIRVQAERVRLAGLAITRELAPEGTICCGDQDLVAFDAGSRDSGVSACLLDGGARGVKSAQVAQGETHAPTGKDCVEARNTGATAEHPVVVENSELRYCHDRGVKSKVGYLRLERNWIHHNLRGGVFALSPTGGATAGGVIEAIANVIEQDGRNCPSGDPRDCGPAQRITRTQASEMSAQGNLTALITAGNVIRGGVLQGMYFQGRSEGLIADDYICGIDNQAGGGNGVLVKMATAPPPVPCFAEEDCEDDGSCLDGQCVEDTSGAPAISMRGVTTAYNADSGVRLNGYRAADFGTDGAAGAGNNAFTDNGFALNGAARLKRNFVNALVDTTALVSAHGNQWQHCYPASGAAADVCALNSISRNDTNNTNAAQPDRVDVGNPQPHASTGTVALDGVAPQQAVEGGLVHITGRGFDAISGHAGGSRDCAALGSGNGCAPLRGTCAEFLDHGQWLAAAAVLAVTPTHLVVRSPITCARPTVLRVRRRAVDGRELVSDSIPFCGH